MLRTALTSSDLPWNTEVDPELAIRKVDRGYRSALETGTITTALYELASRIEPFDDWEQCYCERPSRFKYQRHDDETWQFEIVFANETFDIQVVREFRRIVRDDDDLERVILLLGWTESEDAVELCNGVPGVDAYRIESLLE